MRILLVVTVLITGCCLSVAGRDPQILIERTQTTEDVTEPQQEINLEKLFGFKKEHLKTPDLIPLNVLPDPDVYPITTRIIIEGQPISMKHEGDQIKGVWWAKKMEEVKRDLANAEELYKEIGLKFVVTEVAYKEFQTNVLAHFIDANNHPGTLTIVYMLPNGFRWDGYSSGPWERVTRGIVIHYLADQWTLSHEVGHYFGLMHTFDEDFVGDTAPQTIKFCTGEEFSTTNCHNIMNYCDHEPKLLTPGQVDRFKRFLRSKRMNHFDRERADLFLRGHKFPTPTDIQKSEWIN